MTTTTQPNANEKLARFGLAESDVERLATALAQEDPLTRRLVHGALRELGDAAAPTLSKLLRSANPILRAEAARLLGKNAAT